MATLDEYLPPNEGRQVAQAEARRRADFPTGWEPRVVEADGHADATSQIFDAEPDEVTLLEGWRMDPDVWQIVEGSLLVNRWQTAAGDWCYQYKARLLRRRGPRVDVDELLRNLHRIKAPAERTGAGTLVVCASDWQVGKALSDDTPVLTPNGWCNHGDIRPGDFVFGADGAPKQVLAVTGSTFQDCYRVKFDRGVELVASGQHLWQGWRRYKQSSSNIYERRSLLWTTEQIAALKPTVRDNRSYVERAFHVDLPEPIQFPHADLGVDPYILGVWLGDGKHTTGSITSHEDDVQHWLSSLGDASLNDHRGVNGQATIRIQGLTKALRSAGVLGAKSVPHDYLYSATDQRLALLQGLMDTDGHANDKGICEFVNTNIGIAQAVAFLATSLGMKCTVTPKQPTLNGVAMKPALRVQFTPDASLWWQQAFRLPRKLARLRVRSGDQARFRFVQSVESAGKVSAQCLTVEGGLYLAGRDLVVTHNSDGDGTEGTVRRIVESGQRIIAHARKVRPARIVVVGMGDLIEGCDGHYAAQTFTVQLDRRQQTRVVRRLLRDWIVGLSRLGVPVVVSAVAGNHGENRKDGKAFTGPGDNDDVAVVEVLAEVLAANPDAFGHVAFHIPDDRLEVVLDVEGWRVGFHHGHIAGKGATPQQKQANWWKDMAFQQSLIGDSQILVTGHYHHLSVVDLGPRVHFQCPAMDGGSRWWEDRGGGKSATGTLTFMVGESGWDGLRVL